MNTFKKLLIVLMFPSVSVFANPSLPKEPIALAGQNVKKEQAKRVIRRTAVVIHVAHKKVKEGKVYTGNLARSIAHQRFAIKLFREGKFFRAIHHSRRARALALLAIKANKGAETGDMKLTKEEEGLMKGGPSDADLDKALAAEMPGASEKDEDAVAKEPDADLKENE